MDIIVFCRPFDDKTQSRIAQEASAFVTILAEVVAGNVTCIGSDILDIEVNNTPDEVKKVRLLNLTGYCSEKVIMDEAIRNLGSELESRERLKPRDALHIASATRGLADYFLTCDDKIVKRAKKIQNFLVSRGMKLQILNPIDFLKKLT
jgi:predicted nucleic acid-binding protein